MPETQREVEYLRDPVSDVLQSAAHSPVAEWVPGSRGACAQHNEMMDVTPDALGRATAMVTLALSDDSNVVSPLVPLARLGPGRLSDELIATLRAMACLSARLAGTVGETTGEPGQVILQRVAARLQAELLTEQ